MERRPALVSADHRFSGPHHILRRWATLTTRALGVLGHQQAGTGEPLRRVVGPVTVNRGALSVLHSRLACVRTFASEWLMQWNAPIVIDSLRVALIRRSRSLVSLQVCSGRGRDQERAYERYGQMSIDRAISWVRYAGVEDAPIAACNQARCSVGSLAESTRAAP